MSLTPTSGLPATLCPLPQTPLATLYAGSSPPTPVVGTAVGSGSAGAQGLVTLVNADQVRGNLNARYGGGAYAVATGLELTEGSGLTLNIGVGLAMLDGPSEVRSAATLALTAGVINRVWISRAGTISAVTSLSDTPYEPPDASAPWCYLGAVYCTDSIYQIDYSGRLTQYQGNLLFRQTADAGEPGDAATLPSTVRFFTRTEGGLYLWTGAEYEQVSGAAEALAVTVTSQAAALDDLERRFRLQLQWTAQSLGYGFIHPDLMHEVPLAG